jgi:hypothetical protein
VDRNTAFASAATAAVVSAIVLGFWNIGSPGNQREIGADQRRSEDLQAISNAVRQRYSGSTKMPSSLAEIQSNAPYLRIRDPLTHAPYEFRSLGGSQYQLCASFSTDIRNEQNAPGMYTARLFTKHAQGRQCFDLDALRSTYTYP